MALLRDVLMADSVGLRDDNVDYDDGFYFTSSASVSHASSSPSSSSSSAAAAAATTCDVTVVKTFAGLHKYQGV